MLTSSVTAESWGSEFWNYCDDVGCKTFCDEPLGSHTSMGVGGPADVFVSPETIEQLAGIRSFCADASVPF
ncbi:hypothetical protein J7M28_03620, partial [bacterium]|nr:hypothetical protein [bacterium]